MKLQQHTYIVIYLRIQFSISSGPIENMRTQAFRTLATRQQSTFYVRDRSWCFAAKKAAWGLMVHLRMKDCQINLRRRTDAAKTWNIKKKKIKWNIDVLNDNADCQTDELIDKLV
jgi:hypothetical protein